MLIVRRNLASMRRTLSAQRVPQQKILEDGFSVATREGPTANTAGYPTINNFRSGLNCDDVIKRVAI
jgi:hypothetical protein